jgi:hypothetical protein
VLAAYEYHRSKASSFFRSGQQVVLAWWASGRKGKRGRIHHSAVGAGTNPSRTNHQWASRAIIIVHGIGEQPRLSTRDSLMRGFEKVGGTDCGEVPGPPTPFGKPLPAMPKRVQRQNVEADVYEGYWAPFTSHKTTARSVLGWMLAMTFLPRAAIRPPSRKTMADLVQIGLFFVVGAFLILVGVGLLGNLIAQASDHLKDGLRKPSIEWHAFWVQLEAMWGQLRAAATVKDQPLINLTPDHISEVITSLSLYTWLLLFLIVWFAAQLVSGVSGFVASLLTPKRPVRGKGKRHLVLQAVLVALKAVALYFLLQAVAPQLIDLVLVVALARAIQRTVRKFLAESFGDVQVYSNRDENNDHFAARKAVTEAVEDVFSMIAGRKYEEVVVIGHSLGAVVAYDILDGLRYRDPILLGKVRALVTFGAALEKVDYFFDRKEKDHPERGDLVERAFSGVARERSWINLWYSNDVVANPITSFASKNNFSFRSRLNSGDAGLLLKEGRDHLVVNVSLGWPLWPQFPPIHSHYLKDRRVLELLGEIGLSNDISTNKRSLEDQVIE